MLNRITNGEEQSDLGLHFLLWPFYQGKIGFQYHLSLNAGQKNCRMLQGKHSAILSTFIKRPFSIKTFVLSIFEWLLKTGFTVSFYQLQLKIFRVLNISALCTTDSIVNFSFSENKSIFGWLNEPFLYVLLRFLRISIFSRKLKHWKIG